MLVTFYSLTSNAQTSTPEVVNIAGGTANIANFQLEWSVGEVTAIETYSQSTFYITNGFLQPNTDNITLINNANIWTADEIKIFPTPTTGKFELDVLTKQQGILNIQMVNFLGQAIQTYSYNYYGYGKIQLFDISNLASGAYYLRIKLVPSTGFIQKNGSFKIIKIK